MEQLSHNAEANERSISDIQLLLERAMTGVLKVRQPEQGRKLCECGCGQLPKGKKSRFLPGHDLRKAYNDRG
jgi:hypothetical protein